MKIICKHNGNILTDYGFGNIEIDEIVELTEKNLEMVKERIRFRATDTYDFEYGIGGFVGDEYYKIKNIKFSNNDSEIIVRVSKI
ncbi:MAG: hypothetical protein KAI79_06775 [Bacteroidales bacterium]|nr:hypothetical protein [Bacteroidales bacterium]